MAAIILSSDEFVRQMEEAGIPHAQADVIAKGAAGMLVQNFDVLVTKDYLDTRFDEFEARLWRELDRDLDRRFAEVDRRFGEIDRRFAAQDQRITELDHRMQLGFARMEARFARTNVMLAVIMAAVALPMIQSLLSLLGG